MRASSSVTSASCCAAAGRGTNMAATPTATQLQANRIRDRLEQIDDMGGNAGERVLVRERDERRHAGGEELARRRPLDGIPERHAPGRELPHPAAHLHQIVVARRPAVLDAHLGNREVHALLLELLIRQARLTHQLGARAIEPDEVVGVIDQPHLVCLGIIDAQRYRADHGEATSTGHLEKSNGTGACGPWPAFLACGPCLPPAHRRAFSSSPMLISDKSHRRSAPRCIASSTRSPTWETRSSSTGTCSIFGSSTAPSFPDCTSARSPNCTRYERAGYRSPSWAGTTTAGAAIS